MFTALLLIRPWLKYLALAVAVLAAVFFWNRWLDARDAEAFARGDKAGAARVQALWDAERRVIQDRVIAESEVNAKETIRRLVAQQANQERQNAELQIARAAADRNSRDVERLRKQLAADADQWSAALRDSPTSADIEAAASAIRVLTDVCGRLDKRASVLAEYADAARAAGLKCERDYEALEGRERLPK